MRDTTSPLAQALAGMLSLWRVASIVSMALVAVALLVALVVTSGVGPHLAHVALVAQSLAHNLLANGGNPHPLCPGGAPTC